MSHKRRIQPVPAHPSGPLTLQAAVEWVEAGTATPEEAVGIGGLKRFAMTAYTGGAMRLGGWGVPVVVDLAGMTAPNGHTVPILLNHDPNQIVGHSDNVEIATARMGLAGMVSGTGSAAQEVLSTAKNGFPWRASIGAQVNAVEFVPSGKKADANGQTFNGPCFIARRSTLGEVSFTPTPADSRTAVTVAAQAQADQQENTTMTFTEWLTASGFDAATLTDVQRTNLEKIHAAQTPTEKVEDAPADPLAEFRATQAAETTRVAAIRAACDGKHPVIEAQAITGGWTLEKTEVAVLKAERPSAPAVQTVPITQAPEVLTAALCLRAGMAEDGLVKEYGDKTMEAAYPFRNLSLGRLIEIAAREVGHTTRADFDDATIRAAFTNNALVGITGAVANKTMLAAFTAFQAVAPSFCEEVDLQNFQLHTRYRLTGTGAWKAVGPDGELKHGELGEESYTNQLGTVGQLLSLTRKMVYDDDMGGFLQIPRMIGRQGALAREKAIFALVLASQASGFFAAGNKNLLTGADTALSIDALTAAEKGFIEQTDSNGDPLSISPSLLLVPPGLKVPAEQLMTVKAINETTTANKPKVADNPHTGKFTVLSSPFMSNATITGYSPIAWYLLASPADLPAFQIAYLRGQRTPVIERGDVNFNQLGIYYRGFWDFGVAAQDPRAAQKNAGQ